MVEFSKYKFTGKKIRPLNDSDNAAIVQAKANASGKWVQWIKVPTQGDYFHLQNVETGKFFRPVDDTDDATLQTKPVTNNGNFTQWKQISATNGYAYLENRQTRKFIRPVSEDDISPDTGTNFNII